jgi:2-dehydropantoate 2-reductase
MRVCIYGAGAIGGWVGARLARAGHEVSAVARGATLEALRRHGWRLREGEADGAEAVRASDDPASLGEQDLVVVAVKAFAMAEVARSIRPLLGPQTAVLAALNGVPWWFFEGFGGPYEGTRLKAVDPGGAIAAAIPAASVVGCVVFASCSLEAPGFARHHFGNRLVIGAPSGETTAHVERAAALLGGAGFEVEVSDEVRRVVWYKLWGNMTVGPLSAMTGATTDQLLGDELVWAFASRVMLEAKAVGERLGIPIAELPEDRRDVTLKLGAFKTSMLQDVEAQKAVELDALVTAVKEIGELTGVATPFLDALLGLARLHARLRGLY